MRNHFKARSWRQFRRTRLRLRVVQYFLTTYKHHSFLSPALLRDHVPQPASGKASESTQHHSTSGEKPTGTQSAARGGTAGLPNRGKPTCTPRPARPGDREKPRPSATAAGSPSLPDVPPPRARPLTFTSAGSLFPLPHRA